MVKILSNSGDSLADLYDVEGSIAGIENLETRDLPIVHEMGGTVFSERFGTNIRRMASGDTLQSLNIDIVIDDLPITPTRALGIAVITDDAARLSRAAVMVRDPEAGAAGQEFPIWQWDETNFTSINLIDVGDAVVTGYSLLRATFEATYVPNFIGGIRPAAVPEIAFRASTNAFGAGTVFVRALLFIAFASTGTSGVSSRGLPIPSW